MSLGFPEPDGKLYITIGNWDAITHNGTSKEQETHKERRIGHDCEKKLQGGSGGRERMRGDPAVQSSDERYGPSFSSTLPTIVGKANNSIDKSFRLKFPAKPTR
jgi:hypothetical protein